MATSESWHNVGLRIRQMRKQYGLTLKQLAQGCGLSANAISLVERGEVAPTVLTLCKIASALGAPASSFLQDVCPSEVVLQRARISEARQPGDRLLDALANGLSPATVCRQPGRGLSGKYAPQMALCLCGEVDFETGEGQVYTLHPGDRLSCNSLALQSWSNSAAETAVVVLVFPPPGAQPNIDGDDV